MRPSTPTLRIPVHVRDNAGFHELLGVPATAVLASMDAADDDVPTHAPAVAARIDAVGMTRHDVLVTIRDPFGSGGPVHAICTLRLTAAVPATRRGLHLSRIGSIVAARSFETYGDVMEYASTLATAIASAEYGEATAAIDARVPYIETLACERPTSKLSLEHLNLTSSVTVGSGRTVIDAGIRVSHIVACPCVQRSFKHALQRRHDPSGGQDGAQPPLLTHSQRAVTTLTVLETDRALPIVDVLAALDAVLVRTCNTLPRDLELACVYRAHAAPQFIEDALRSAVVAVREVLGPGASFASVHGTSRSLESIHDYDLSAEMTVNRGECVVAAGATGQR
jgi:GTP cyclohydrolase FolE2